MSPIRVLHVLQRVRAGGALTLTQERIRRLDPERIDSEVCALLPSSNDQTAVEVLAEWAASGVPVHVLGHRSRRDVPRTVAAMTRLARSADIVHVVNSAVGHGVIGAKLARRPLVCDQFSTAPPGRNARFAARVATVNLSISHAVAAVHQAPRTRVVYPPLNLTFPAAAPPRDVSTGDPTVLVVSRLSAYKGVQYLPAIVRALVDRAPNARVLIAGDGEGRDQLVAQLRDRGVDPNVAMLGYRSDVPALHAVADVYLSTSEAEGLVGYSTLEAAMADTPIVASPIPAVTEVFRDRQHVLLAEPTDAFAVADAVLELADSALGDALASSARQRVLEMLDPETAVTKLMELYQIR